jgi:hypothetical protein
VTVMKSARYGRYLCQLASIISLVAGPIQAMPPTCRYHSLVAMPCSIQAMPQTCRYHSLVAGPTSCENGRISLKRSTWFEKHKQKV